MIRSLIKAWKKNSKTGLLSSLLFLGREVKGAPVLKILDLSSSNLNDEALYQVECLMIKRQLTAQNNKTFFLDKFS